jgi:hypothetical protein
MMLLQVNKEWGSLKLPRLDAAVTAGGRDDRITHPAAKQKEGGGVGGGRASVTRA